MNGIFKSLNDINDKKGFWKNRKFGQFYICLINYSIIQKFKEDILNLDSYMSQFY